MGTENAAEGQGQAPEQGAVQPTEQTQEQPVAGSPDPSQTSQGLIEPYLEDVAPELRDKVAPVLERFRADQDARVNRKLEEQAGRVKQYEQYGDPEQVAIASQVLNSFMADPIETTKWLMEQAETDLGVDVRNALLETARSQESNGQAPDPSTPEGQEALTADAVVQILEQREQAKAQEQKRQTIQQQQAEQARQRAIGWFEESVGNSDIPTDSLTEGVKSAMFSRAHELRQSGLANDGRTAIDMAVSEFNEAFSRVKGGVQPTSPEPTVTQGGTAPPPQGFDVSNDKDRKQAMLDNLMARTGAGT